MAIDARRSIAYHEAGHAVAACELGIAFTRVSIVADDTSLGRLSFRDPVRRSDVHHVDRFRRDLFERYIIVGLAGAESTRLVEGDYDALLSAQHDYRDAFTFVHLILRSQTEVTRSSREERLLEGKHYFLQLQERARQLLHARRSWLDALASALTDQEILTGSDAVRIMLAAMPRGEVADPHSN
jgi:hypothetical protein